MGPTALDLPYRRIGGPYGALSSSCRVLGLMFAGQWRMPLYLAVLIGSTKLKVGSPASQTLSMG